MAVGTLLNNASQLIRRRSSTFVSHSKNGLKLVFLGAPGAGKGTYASRVAGKFGLDHVSTGDLIRAEIQSRTILGMQLKEMFYDQGRLIPDDVVLNMLARHLSISPHKGYILDGFPRTLEQAIALDRITNVDAAILFDLDEEVLLTKLSGRRVCGGCGTTYNIAHVKLQGMDMPPILPKAEGKCDNCSSSLVQRDDDKPETISKRLAIYHQQIQPILDHYDSNHLLHHFVITKSTAQMLPHLETLLHVIEQASSPRPPTQAPAPMPHRVAEPSFVPVPVQI